MKQERLKFDEKTITKALTNIISGSISKHWRDGRSKKYLYEITPSETGIIGITAEFAEI